MIRELNLDKLADHTREELELYVRMLALKLEKTQADLLGLKAKINRAIGHGNKKNPHVT
jgi:hypothetical protein